MFVHPTNTAVILDLKGFLIDQKFFISKEYQNITIIIKGESETCPISEIAIIILFSLSKGAFALDIPEYIPAILLLGAE